MKLSRVAMSFALAIAAIAMPVTAVLAQVTGGTALADPWPRVLDLRNGQVLVYQPQVNSWKDNQLDLRAALALKRAGEPQESFGTVFATARTDVDRTSRMVTLQDIKLRKLDFPALPDHGASIAAELQAEIAKGAHTIALDRLEASLAAAGIKPVAVPVRNEAPRVIAAYSTAILVPIDGKAVLKPVAQARRFERVINTRALILKGGFEQQYYLHVYDGWLAASVIEGPWSQTRRVPLGMDDVASALAKAGIVDLLDGGAKANPKPSLANGVPQIYTSQVPAELIMFNGQPDFVPIVGTQLLWASNTTSDVLIDTRTNDFYALLAGRWFRAIGMDGPWTFVANDALPGDFAHIPPHSLAGAVLPTVAGTVEAQEAMIANSIPQTATIPRAGGPQFKPSFDGAPDYATIPDTSLAYVVNSGTPIIRVTPTSYYGVSGGVWFTAPGITGPWVVATSVPVAIYAIPSSSPIHYVTYVHLYGYTPKVVYIGYTPGYMGAVVGPYGTVVYGTGYAYTPWVGTAWYPAPYTYGIAAAPVYNAAVGYTFGFAMGLATAAWTTPYWGGAYYHPAYWGSYPCCGSASANVYGHYGSTSWSGTRTAYAGGGVVGQSASGSYVNARTGTSGSYNAGRQYNAYTGNATRGYDRTVNTPAGGSANVARAGNYNTYTGQRSYGSSVNATGAGGSSVDRTAGATAGPSGYAHAASTTTYNAHTGQTNSWQTGSVGNNHYADVNGNVYKNTGDGWQQHSSSGWQNASGDTSAAARESQARSSGDDRFGSFADSGGGGARSFGGGSQSAGGWGGRFGGGGEDRFSGGGFGGGRRR
jgi:hypothetical protein